MDEGQEFEADVVVIGAGVVGLAIARTLARAGRDVLVLEKERAIGSQTSSRNSEVVHAGIYYSGLPLKQRLCLKGRDLLYEFCDNYGVTYAKCGKLVVATDEDQVPTLERILTHSECAHTENGLQSRLTMIDGADARTRIEGLNCVAALVSPDTGIVDSHGFMLALQGDAEAHGAQLAFGATVTSGSVANDQSIQLEIAIGGNASMSMRCRTVINAAGHGTVPIAHAITGQHTNTFPQAHFARGVYFRLQGRHPFTQLVYPVPVAGGLGTHVTVDLGGQARFGPDVEWINHLSYDIDPARADSFYEAIRRYWPALPDGALVPDYAGVRPKISGPGEPNADFDICGEERHGVPGLIHLLGIESPGLTSSLAIAEDVAARVDGQTGML